MRILISNDDGVTAPGLAALHGALKDYADCVVIAPDQDKSGASSSLTLDRPLHPCTLDNGFISLNGYVQRSPAVFGAGNHVDRHRIQHLIAEDRAFERFRQRVKPAHLREIAQQFLLAGAQFSGQLDDGITLDHDAGIRRLGQNVLGQLARTSAEFEDMRRALVHNSGCDMRQRLPEQGAQLGRSCKIAILAELGGAAAVIAQAGRIQRQLHEAGKRDGATLPGNVVGNQALQGVGRGQRVGGRCW